ncbi:hypothetical protein TNCV_3911001 [Trichonephila clavipes]|nr:hypothetical protein TNCV_3911001 [Trichonephila clavipes]
MWCEKKTASVFATLRAILQVENQSSSLAMCLYIEQNWGNGTTMRRSSVNSSVSRMNIINFDRKGSADGPTNLEQPTLNHVQSDTMAPAVLADPTCALQETNQGSGPAVEESENDVAALAVCGRALSCWKIAPGRPFRKGPTWGRRISSM